MIALLGFVALMVLGGFAATDAFLRGAIARIMRERPMMGAK
jgi:phosphoribosylformylglycinamidine (FGAM) synthase-like amidotransferase family enzyme